MSWLQCVSFGHSSCILLGFIIVFFSPFILFFFDVTNLFRRILQESFVLYDSIFADIGTTGKHNTNWWNTLSTGIVITTDDNGTTISNTNESTYSRDYAYDGGTIPTSWNDKLNYMKLYPTPVAIEFTVVYYTGNNSILLSDATDKWIGFSDLNVNSGDRVKFVLNGTDVKSYVNDVLKSTNPFSATKTAFALIIQAETSVKYRDLCIYSI